MKEKHAGRLKGEEREREKLIERGEINTIVGLGKE